MPNLDSVSLFQWKLGKIIKQAHIGSWYLTFISTQPIYSHAIDHWASASNDNKTWAPKLTK